MERRKFLGLSLMFLGLLLMPTSLLADYGDGNSTTPSCTDSCPVVNLPIEINSKERKGLWGSSMR